MFPKPQIPETSGKKAGANRAAVGASVGLRALAHYRILRSIGTGGMSEVYLAYDAKLRKPVAVKVLTDHLVGNHTFVNRFLQEGRLSKDLSHPNIVKAHDFGFDKSSGKYFIAMEHIDGMTAQERLERDGHFPVADAVRIVIDIARALECLHNERYVHRDIKPGNILIGPDGSAKLIDLGVAKHLESDNNLTGLDQSVGTPYYMPWEQGLNSSIVDARSDIFALGATFYHLVTGHVPFPGDDEITIAHKKEKGTCLPVTQHIRHLPEIIDRILERMIARDPRRRFSSARDVVETLTASGLAEAHGTFADFDLPEIVPQPLAPTRADLASQAHIDTPLETDNDQVWALKYKRVEDGSWRKLRGRTRDIVRLYQESILPDEVFAAREPSEVFRRLKAYPEFRNLTRRPKDAPIEKKRANPLRKPRDSGTHFGAHWSHYLGSLFFTGLLSFVLFTSASTVLRLMVGHH